MDTGRFLFCLAMLGLAVPSDGDLCKWVDEDGVVHYAERCPEGVDGTAVITDPEPSEARIEAAQRQSESLRQQREGARKSAELAQKEKLSTHAESATEWKTLKSRCEQAFRERDLLAVDLPVFRDPGGRLHHRESLHHHLYEGQRTYLEDSVRAMELSRTEALISRECADVRPDKSNYVYRFRDKPNLDETLDLLAAMNLPDGPPPDEVCAYAKILQQDLRELRSGILSDKERELDRLLNADCR